MALTGYPKTFDHPKITRLEWNALDGPVNKAEGGNYMLIKAFGDDATEWIEYEVKYPNSASPSTPVLIRCLVGTSLSGPFSYVKHFAEGTSNNPVNSPQNCFTLVYDVED